MGFFSWKTGDTKKVIWNCYANTKPNYKFTVYMKDNNNNIWKETNYKGYGIFGGKDFFELLSEMNGKTDREDGIKLWFGKQPFLSPILVEDKKIKFDKKYIPETHGGQGFFIFDDEDNEYIMDDYENDSD